MVRSPHPQSLQTRARRRRWAPAALAAGCTALVVGGSLLSTGGITGAPVQPGHPAPPPGCTTSTPFRAGTSGYASFRIPAVVRAKDGTLLAYAEGRVGGTSDTGDIDLVQRRSTDGGCHWSALQVLIHGDGTTRGNPAPVVDPRTGTVVLVSVSNSGDVSEHDILAGQVTPEQGRRVWVQTSRNAGLTYTPPREITTRTKAPGWRWYATTPGHAIVLERGPHRGRIVVAANHSVAPSAGSPDDGTQAKYYGGHSIYSDDLGVSWRIGYVDDTPDDYLNVNESTAAELLDGRVYFNARDQNGTAPGTRADAYSVDGGASLVAPFAPNALLVSPVVQGSVLQLTGSRGAPLLYSGPAEPSGRAAMTIRRSDDAGVTWRSVLPISGLPAGYSDLVQLSDHTIGLLYETGTTSPYDRIDFRVLPVSSLSGR